MPWEASPFHSCHDFGTSSLDSLGDGPQLVSLSLCTILPSIMPPKTIVYQDLSLATFVQGYLVVIIFPVKWALPWISMLMDRTGLGHYLTPSTSRMDMGLPFWLSVI